MSVNGDSNTGPPIQRSIDPAADEVPLHLVELIADLEDCDVTDLPPLWPLIDDILEREFSSPPAETADLHVEFTYYGYRVRVSQDGETTLSRLDGA